MARPRIRPPAAADGSRPRGRLAALVLALSAGWFAACAGPSGGGGSAAPAPPPAGSTPGEGGPRIVQAGPPGAASRPFEGASLGEVEGLAHTPADVAFMQGMIHHHAQALDMTALISERTANPAIRRMGLRMEISQQDEIALMERWLANRGQEVPDWSSSAEEAGHSGAAGAHGEHADMHHGAADGRPAMPGMLTSEQMAALAAARDEAFDRLFLELMIQHHEGALVMVQELFASPGAGQESEVFRLASEIDADQAIEIRRMRELLAEGG